MADGFWLDMPLMARNTLNAAVRRATDVALKECGAFVMLDDKDHVTLLDGDIDTADIADSIAEHMLANGWTFEWKAGDAKPKDR